jgi:hypothetical protein
MADSSQTSDGGRQVSPYRTSNHPGPHPGTETTCELCEAETRCFAQYGLTVCQACHHELLPGAGVFSGAGVF